MKCRAVLLNQRVAFKTELTHLTGEVEINSSENPA
jgi:hypothetical protein